MKTHFVSFTVILSIKREMSKTVDAINLYTVTQASIKANIKSKVVHTQHYRQ